MVGSMSRPRLLIADDHEAMRYMLKLLAEAECDIVGEAQNGQEAVDAAEQLRPDLLLMDVSMPVMGGLEAARLLRERLPERGLLRKRIVEYAKPAVIALLLENDRL